MVRKDLRVQLDCKVPRVCQDLKVSKDVVVNVAHLDL